MISSLTAATDEVAADGQHPGAGPRLAPDPQTRTPQEFRQRLARDAFRRFAPQSNVGTPDGPQMAAARRFGCQWFLSFETGSGCRAMASAAGLKVYPALAARDRKLLARFR